MNGPEHYAEAERLMRNEGWHDPINAAHAQVHATLALAAATALDPAGRVPIGIGSVVLDAWQAVADVRPAAAAS